MSGQEKIGIISWPEFVGVFSNLVDLLAVISFMAEGDDLHFGPFYEADTRSLRWMILEDEKT